MPEAADAELLRARFTEYFVARSHTPVPSAGLIPHHPSAPMFTNSGMMQFVPYFLGEEAVPYDPPRAVSIQKCVRAGGKHNDLDAIGRSPRHLSFFEMLGNFSFGDYFKAEAIPWAWEFVTDTLGIDGDRLWVTCHVDDDEAEDIWADAVGVPRDRIQRLDADNFWEMGDTGPCGPSSEIFFDYGERLGPEGGPANPAAENRYVEIWNLVFTQFFRRADGSLTDLPRRNVDTGAGFERILAVLAGSPSLYAAPTLAVLVDEAQRVTGHRLGASELGDVAVRLLADHIRTSCFLVADGVTPSNDGRGYVLRRVIRRAVRFAYLLGVDRPVLVDLGERCIGTMGGAYPELVEGRDRVLGAIDREEHRFRTTLATGSALLDAELDHLGPGSTLPGAVAFRLHDTYGFPLEVTQEMADLRGHPVDVEEFGQEMQAQRERARAASKQGGVATGEEVETLLAVSAEHGPTEFVGRVEDVSTSEVLAVVGDVVVLDRTPFYAESGGQVGDTGILSGPAGDLSVVDTTYVVPGLIGHRIAPGGAPLSVGDAVTAAIDVERRAAIRRNHTATHILHWALREVLGDHVQQQGSLVAPDRLRFDFSHHQQVSADELRRIEDLANHEILTNAPARHYETTMEHARELGALAFFGDKYGEIVRVLEAGEHSVELCGGTHVARLGDIGPVKIVGETSIGSNIRRLEAISGYGPIERLREKESALADAADLLGVPPDDLAEGIAKRLSELKDLRAQVRDLRHQVASSAAGDLVDTAVDGVVVARVEVDSRDELRDLAVSLRDRQGIRAVVLGASPGGKGVALAAAVDPSSGLDAGDLIADAVKAVGGGGGKGAEIATAGGRDAGALDGALDSVRARFG